MKEVCIKLDLNPRLITHSGRRWTPSKPYLVERRERMRSVIRNRLRDTARR